MGDDRPSEYVMELAVAALEHAAHYLRDSRQLMAMLIVDQDGEALMPLHASAQQPGNRGVVPVLADGPDVLREQVKERRDKLHAYAVVFDAVVDDPETGGKVDAVIAEAGARDAASAYRFALRYRPKGFLRRFRKLGDVVLFERAENLLAG